MVFNPAGEGVAVCSGGRPGTNFQLCVPLAGFKKFLGVNMPGAPAEWKKITMEPEPKPIPKVSSPPVGRLVLPAAPCFT
jgi:hypothetical protein